MDNARILHDSDVYKAALRDYEYSKYKYNSSIPGYADKVKELQQFFSRTGIRRNRNTEQDEEIVPPGE